MDARDQSILTSDIQQALHHAVLEANSTYTQTHHDEPSKKQKKKKRSRDNDDEHVTDGLHKKKKTKKRDIERSGVEVVRAITPDAAQPKKKKSKKKDKGKEPQLAEDQTVFPQIDPQLAALPSTAQASTSAFLSAIVAAASVSSKSQPNLQSQPSYPHSQFDLHPSQLPNCLPYQPHLPYDVCQAPTPFLHMPQPLPTMLPGLPLSDLPFESNEDILRVFQDLDLTKIASVLKTLGEAAAAANVPLGHVQPTFMPPPPQHVQTLTPLGQVPTDSGAILDCPEKQPKESGHRRKLDMTLPGPEQHTNPEHAHWLATKWMNAKKLAELVQTDGLVYKRGKFSAIEEQQLKNAIDNYCRDKQLTSEQLNEVIFAKNDRSKDNAFWSEITAAVPQRPIIAVYHHVRRSFHPLKQQGKWSPAEDALLRQAVADLGQQWEKVSLSVGRMSSDCRDRYRNHIANREVRVAGHWTKEEEGELTRIVTEMTIQQGRDLDVDVFWGKVSDRMENKRSRQQCRIKWTDSLSKTVKNEGQKPRWSQQDAYILVHKIDSLTIRDDTEIDWKTLSDPSWNLWSPHSLQRRWLAMKRSVKGFEDMTHQEIMDILRVKKAQTPAQPATSKNKPRRKVTSPAAVPDVQDEDSHETAPVNEAGSSSGPGTLAQAEALHQGK